MPLLLTLLLLLGTSVYAQDTASIRSLAFYSTILKEERIFNIYTPGSSKGKLEAVYVLDGQVHFNNVVNILKRLGKNQIIVVGIGNIWQRNRDYTPTHVKPSAFVDSMAAAVSGGGQKFISHLEKELIPYINSHYQTDTSRVLIGHSLGGLIAMDIMLNHPGLFRKYIIIDPSMWWDDSKLLKQSETLLQKISKQLFLFLAIANTAENARSNVDAIRKDNTAQTALIRPSISLLDYLKTHPTSNIQLDWKFYKDHDHMSVFQPAVNDGLKFVIK